MRVGFYAWNPFQIYQVESIVRHLPGAEYIIEKRGNIDFDRVFTEEFLSSLNAPVRFIERGDMNAVDENYDAVVCQTAFGRMEELKRAKIIGMQYSMSKERHQYGSWRVLCDLNLVYGQYSYDRISPLSPSVMVGNPRFDRLFEQVLDAEKQAKARASLDATKKTVLYLPTWGELSSIENYGKAVAALSGKYNVIAKVHHKTDTHELSKKEILSEEGIRGTFGAADDLLYLMERADVVLSDYSGAIFDALNAGKPVILLQQDPESVIGAEKFGLESIEYARRDEIGPVVKDPAALAGMVADVLSGKIDYRQVNARIRKESFSQQLGCGKAAAQAIASFLKEPAERPYYQIYMRDTLIESRQSEDVLRKIRKIASYQKVAQDFSAYLLKKIKKMRSFIFGVHQVSTEAIAALLVKTLWQPGREKLFSALTNNLSFLIHSLVLADLAEKYDQETTKTLAVIVARAAFRKSRKNGLTVYIRLLDKYNNTQEMRQLTDKLLALPLNQQASILSRLERLSEIVKYRIEDVRICRLNVRYYLEQAIAMPQGKKKTLRMLEILLSNRWLDEVSVALATADISPEAKRDLGARLALSKERMKHWTLLTEAANANHAPLLDTGSFQCFYKDKIQPVSAVPSARIMEFFLPPYFYEEKVTNPLVHDRICTMLRRMLDAFQPADFAIVPRHQFRLNDACPSGNWQAFSYHTTGNMRGWYHIKDAHIPGYFSLDAKGYSGWSSLASIAALPPAPAKEIERIWRLIQAEIITKKVSKYQQADHAFVPPPRPYIFLPLQIAKDTVANLAYIPGHELAENLAEMVPVLGYDLVIKRHPLCTSSLVERALEKLKGRPGVHIADASIHEILPQAMAVITVNSGVGFEALAYGKKVILAGAADYAFAAQTVTNREELAAALAQAGQPPDVARIRAFLHYYMTEYVFNIDGIPDMIGRKMNILQENNLHKVS